MINLYGILILRIICLCQLDIKLIIAIFSVVHIGIILMRILLLVKLRIFGRYYIIISHGFVSSGLFYLVKTFDVSQIQFLKISILDITSSSNLELSFSFCLHEFSKFSISSLNSFIFVAIIFVHFDLLVFTFVS